MSSQWYGVRVVATDPARLARWWAEVLGYRILDEHPSRVTVGPGAGHPQLSFAPADEFGAGGPLHLDITVDDPDTELERLVNMGARPVEARFGGMSPFAVALETIVAGPWACRRNSRLLPVLAPV